MNEWIVYAASMYLLCYLDQLFCLQLLNLYTCYLYKMNSVMTYPAGRIKWKSQLFMKIVLPRLLHVSSKMQLTKIFWKLGNKHMNFLGTNNSLLDLSVSLEMYIDLHHSKIFIAA